MNATEARIILIYRRTRLEDLVARHNTLDQARFYVERRGGDFEDYLAEETTYRNVLEHAESELKSWGRVQRLERGFLPNYIFAPEDTIVVVGQDGLVANTLKYLDGQAVIAINPDPARNEGVLLPFSPSDLAPIVRETLGGRRPTQQVTMAEAKLSDGQALLAVNDFFVGPRQHTTAAYSLANGEQREHQMSSGVIVCTGLGSTGWMRSIVMGAALLADAVGSGFEYEPVLKNFSWDSRYLLYAVREPYPGATSQSKNVFGRINNQHPFTLESAMAEEGVIFSDGMLDDAIAFNAGSRVDIFVSEKEGRLVL